MAQRAIDNLQRNVRVKYRATSKLDACQVILKFIPMESSYGIEILEVMGQDSVRSDPIKLDDIAEIKAKSFTETSQFLFVLYLRLKLNNEKVFLEFEKKAERDLWDTNLRLLKSMTRTKPEGSQMTVEAEADGFKNISQVWLQAPAVKAKATCSKCKDTVQELPNGAFSGQTCSFERCGKAAQFGCHKLECAYCLCEEHSKVKATCSECCADTMEELGSRAIPAKCSFRGCSETAKIGCTRLECAYHLCEEHSKVLSVNFVLSVRLQSKKDLVLDVEQACDEACQDKVLAFAEENKVFPGEAVSLFRLVNSLVLRLRLEAECAKLVKRINSLSFLRLLAKAEQAIQDAKKQCSGQGMVDKEEFRKILQTLRNPTGEQPSIPEKLLTELRKKCEGEWDKDGRAPAQTIQEAMNEILLQQLRHGQDLLQLCQDRLDGCVRDVPVKLGHRGLGVTLVNKILLRNIEKMRLINDLSCRMYQGTRREEEKSVAL